MAKEKGEPDPDEQVNFEGPPTDDTPTPEMPAEAAEAARDAELVSARIREAESFDELREALADHPDMAAAVARIEQAIDLFLQGMGPSALMRAAAAKRKAAELVYEEASNLEFARHHVSDMLHAKIIRLSQERAKGK